MQNKKHSKNLQNKDGKAENVTLKTIVKHLRNGVCHFYLEFYGDAEIEEIKIADYIPEVTRIPKNQTFEAIFSVELLRRFVIEFSQSMAEKAKTTTEHKKEVTEHGKSITNAGRSGASGNIASQG